jgi:predicted ATPase/transcriptional regulator with XRE-family HTH domain
MTQPETFGHWLRHLRKAKDLTQEELADLVGCASETIRKIEAGGRKPSRQMAELLAECLDVPQEERPAFIQFARVGAETEEQGLTGLPELLHPHAADTLPPPPRERTNLPIWPTSFIGREKERAKVRELLMQGPPVLLTLTGPPGIGKTRLSFQVAFDLLDEFCDGVFYVALSPVTDPALVIAAINQTLKIKETPNQDRIELLKNYLHDKQMLLVLDNFEHVVEAGSFVAEFLTACPDLRVMVSSRAALNIYGEHEFLVPPLAIPDPEETPDLKAMAQCEAIDLFVQRSQAVNANFELTEANALLVAEICRQLDGLPLAIELAAARSKVLPAHTILARLSDRLRLLTTGGQDLTPRQQTLRGAIDWSYDLLGMDDQILFRRMSAFVGGATLDSVEGVCRLPGEPEGKIDALEGVSSLLGKSLLRRVDEPHVEGEVEARFSMYWTIREYASERLAESGEEQAVRRQHAAFFLRLAEAAEPHLTSGGRGPWMERLETEHNNLRTALEWCQSEAGDHAMGLRLAGALCWFWYFRGYFSEGRRWLEVAVAQTGELRHTAIGAKVLYAAGKFTWAQDDRTKARALLEECVACWRDLGDQQYVAYALVDVGIVMTRQGEGQAALSLAEKSIALFREVGDKWGLAYALDILTSMLVGEQYRYERAETFARESLALFRELGDKWGIAQELDSLARIALQQGDYSKARALFEEALVIQRAAGDKYSLAFVAQGLGSVAHCEGDYAGASALYHESLVLFRELGDRIALVGILRRLGHVALYEGDLERANSLYEQSLSIAKERGTLPMIALSLAGLAGLLGAQGELERAAKLFGAAAALLEKHSLVMPEIDRIEHNRNLAAVRSVLADEAFNAAWAEGQIMTVEQALVCVTKDTASI